MEFSIKMHTYNFIVSKFIYEFILTWTLINSYQCSKMDNNDIQSASKFQETCEQTLHCKCASTPYDNKTLQSTITCMWINRHFIHTSPFFEKGPEFLSMYLHVDALECFNHITCLGCIEVIMHPKLRNINLHNITHSLTSQIPREHMFIVQISLLVVIFLSLISRNLSLMQATKEINLHPHIAPHVNMWSATSSFFFRCHLLNVGACICHIG